MITDGNQVTASARIIDKADEAHHHRVREDGMARMTAAVGDFGQQRAAQPQILPIAVSPPLISNVANIQNYSPNYFETINNTFQTAHNFHQNNLAWFNNSKTNVLNYLGLNTPGPEGDGTLLQPVLNGEPPPPPPSAGAARIALQDGSAYSPEVPIDVAPLPSPMGPDDPPLAIRDRPNAKPIKRPPLKPKPKIKVDPPVVPKKPIIILDPPPRKKPRRQGR